MQKVKLTIESADRAEMERLLADKSTSAKVFKRCTALMQMERGEKFKTIASNLSVNSKTVNVWRTNYLSLGLGCLQDQPRPGRPIEITGEQRAKITAIACSEPEDGFDTWQLRIIANKAVELEIVGSISHTHVANILKKTNLNRT
jgi:transposase